jgi:hypothetical protein
MYGGWLMTILWAFGFVALVVAALVLASPLFALAIAAAIGAVLLVAVGLRRSGEHEAAGERTAHRSRSTPVSDGAPVSGEGGPEGAGAEAHQEPYGVRRAT